MAGDFAAGDHVAVRLSRDRYLLSRVVGRLDSGGYVVGTGYPEKRTVECPAGDLVRVDLAQPGQRAEWERRKAQKGVDAHPRPTTTNGGVALN